MQQGLFENYTDAMRSRLKSKYGIDADMVVSANHNESSPDTVGIYGAETATGELGWRMPLHPEFLELTKGQYADLTNASEQRKASSSYAAEFLRQFVDDKPWVHVDIAGTAWAQGRPYNGSGASGFGVRMLVELAQRVADAARRG